MKRGKKSLAERIVYTAIDKSREGSDSVDPLEVLNKALENVTPASRSEIPPRRRRDLSGADGSAAGAPGLAGHALDRQLRRQSPRACRWPTRSPHEIKDAAAGQGNAIKKRDDTHKMAQANRAFAHFRW